MTNLEIVLISVSILLAIYVVIGFMYIRSLRGMVNKLKEYNTRLLDRQEAQLAAWGDAINVAEDAVKNYEYLKSLYEID